MSFAADRYDAMPYRRCGRSGLLLPAISLGAWETFGGYRAAEIARDALFRAFDLGITHFDFANNYGHPPGNAEIVCGTVIKQMPRDELIISNKAGFRMWPGRAVRRLGLAQELDGQLRSITQADGIGVLRHLLSPPP